MHPAPNCAVHLFGSNTKCNFQTTYLNSFKIRKIQQLYTYTKSIQIYDKYPNIQQLYKYTKNIQMYNKWANMQTHTFTNAKYIKVRRENS